MININLVPLYEIINNHHRLIFAIFVFSSVVEEQNYLAEECSYLHLLVINTKDLYFKTDRFLKNMNYKKGFENSAFLYLYNYQVISFLLCESNYIK